MVLLKMPSYKDYVQNKGNSNSKQPSKDSHKQKGSTDTDDAEGSLHRFS